MIGWLRNKLRELVAPTPSPRFRVGRFYTYRSQPGWTIVLHAKSTCLNSQCTCFQEDVTIADGSAFLVLDTIDDVFHNLLVRVLTERGDGWFHQMWVKDDDMTFQEM